MDAAETMVSETVHELQSIGATVVAVKTYWTRIMLSLSTLSNCDASGATCGYERQEQDCSRRSSALKIKSNWDSWYTRVSLCGQTSVSRQVG